MAFVTNTLPVEATHSSLDLFERPSMIVNFERAVESAVLPTSSANSSQLDFRILSELRHFIDLRSIMLELVVKFVNTDGTDLRYHATDVDERDECSFANNLLHSLFKECDVEFNSIKVSKANGLYAYVAYVETETSFSKAIKETLLKCQGYTIEDNPGDIGTPAFTNRRVETRRSAQIHLIGKLAVDVFNCEKLLLPGVDLRVRLIRNDHDFVVISEADAKHYKCVIEDAQLYVVKHIVKEPCVQAIENALNKSPAIYSFTEVIPKTFVMTNGITKFSKENVFMSQPVKRFALMMFESNPANPHRSNPYNFQKLAMREIKVSLNGMSVCGTPLSTTNVRRAFCITYRSLALGGNTSLGVPVNQYADGHFILVFDLTSTLDASQDCIEDNTIESSTAINSNVKIEISFGAGLPNATDLFLVGERDSILYINKSREVSLNNYLVAAS